MRSRRGFTSIELLLSAALLAVLLLSGLLAARSATTVAQDSIRTSAAQHRATRAVDELRLLLLQASRGTLAARPADGAPLEPMAEDVAYDNVAFRVTTSNGPGGPTLEPDPADPPSTIELEGGDAAGGERGLVWFDGTGRRSIGGGIQELELVRTGSRVTIRITASARGRGSDVHTAVGSLVLHNP